MDTVRIRNLRSLKDTDNLSFKGLTVLLGENSVGKSTLLRSFPLIKQSIETETTTPLLWFGNYVDFGSFRESVNRDNNKIILNFIFSLNKKELMFRHYKYLNQLGVKNIEVEIHIVEGKKSYHNLDYINEMIINFGDYSVRFCVSNEGAINVLDVNNKNYAERFKDYKMATSKASIIPRIIDKDSTINDELYFYSSQYGEEFEHDLIEILKDVDLKDFEIINDTFYSDKEEAIENILNSCKITDIVNGYEKLNKKNTADTVAQIIELFILKNIEMILEYVSREIFNYYRNVYYIAPIRATAERYYRIQNLAVDKVDFQGRNIPVLLNSMSKCEYEKFNKWVKKNFDFEIQTKGIEGHISINIIKENEIVNISDCGFGYSQILPIIVQLWIIINNKSNQKVTLLIEQPELHLHPKMQADLIDAFINCIRLGQKLKDNINIIIETHSETIINRIGYLIYKDKILKDEVNIYLFEKNDINETIVRTSSYDENGYLENWPIGFFEPKED